MQVAQILAGYTLGEADLLRRAMGKKIRSEMEAQRARFVAGAIERGIERAQAEAIFELLERFAEYGFNKSHAARLCAGRLPDRLHEGELSGRVPGRVDDARHGQYRQALRIPRRGRAARHQGRAAVDQPLGRRPSRSRATRSTMRWPRSRASARRRSRRSSRRAASKPFADLADFASRINPRAVNKRVLESLAAAGAFDALERNRARAFAAVDADAWRRRSARTTRAAIGQNELFGGRPRATPLPLPTVEPWLPAERLQKEFDAIGFFLSGHPLDDYAAALKRMRVQSWAEFARAVKAGASAGRVAGTVVSRRSGAPAPAARWASSGCPIRPGTTRRCCSPKGWRNIRDLLEPGTAVLLFAVGGAAGRRRARAHPVGRAARPGGREAAEGPARLPARRSAARERRQAAARRPGARQARTRSTARSRWC